jgi:hypothetical protein
VIKLSSGNEKVTWITCPDCGSRIGIVISIGKASTQPTAIQEEAEDVWPPEEVKTNDTASRLREAGVDLELVDVDESGDVISVVPKKFLGDAWGPINEAMRTLGGTWIREGRNSRWELQKET